MGDKFLLPTGDDRLLKEFNKDFRHNAVIKSGIKRFFLFSEGYKIAAIKLFKQFDGSPFYANMLVYPFIYLNRQFLELRLKELISGLNYTTSQEYKFPNGHDLKQLWDSYKRLVMQVGDHNAPENGMLQNVENLINEFNSIDPKSFSFRYPVDTTASRNPSLSLTSVDLANFMTTMKKLYNFFDMQSDMVFHLIDFTDEFISIMHSEYESEMGS